MALTGLHVACSFAGNSEVRDLVVQVLRAPVWSETFTAAGTTSKAAPASPRPESGDPLLNIFSAVDAYVAIGPNPNATTGPRLFVPARIDTNFAANAGDKLAWIPA